MNQTNRMDEPPPYSVSSNSPPPPFDSKSSNPQSTSQSNYQSPYPTPHGPHLFPKDFGFYHASGSMSNMVIKLKNDDPNPLFYISTHGGFSSQPSVVLHSSWSETSPPLATADFPSFTSSIDIILNPTPSTPAYHTKMEKENVFSSCRTFTFTLPGSTVQERFEWKRSSGAEVASLNGRTHGEKLVRVRTGEVVAAWTYPGMSTRKKGKMSFLGNRAEFGDQFEVLAVVSMVGIMEKMRRQRNKSRGAGGGGGC